MLNQNQKQKKYPKLNLQVQKSSNKEVYKNNIIEALYKSNVIHKKVDTICRRNHINNETLIHEDITQEVFYHLSKKSADEIIEMYEDNQNRLIALCTTIAAWNGVGFLNNKSTYPKRSVAKYILFSSNLNQLEYLSTTDEGEDDDVTKSEMTCNNEEHENEMWETIFDELTGYKKQLLNQYLNRETTRGAFKKKYRKRIKGLIASIETEGIKHNYKEVKMDKEIKKQVLETINEKLIPVIKQYHETRSVKHLTKEDRQEMKDVWKHIHPTSYFTASCASCMKTILDTIESWYGRESIKWKLENPETFEIKNESITDEPLTIQEPIKHDESFITEQKTIKPITKKIAKPINKKTIKKKNDKKNKTNHKRIQKPNPKQKESKTIIKEKNDDMQ